MERYLLQVTGTETRLGNVKNVRKNGDGSFELSDTFRTKFEPIPRKKERRKNEKIQGLIMIFVIMPINTNVNVKGQIKNFFDDVT